MARSRGRSVSDVTRYTSRSSAPSSFGRPQDDEPVTSGVTFALVAIVTFLVICFLAVRFGTANIEDDIEARSLAALRSAGFLEVEVDASGTNVALSGSYTQDQDDQDAFDAVAAVPGIGDVEGQIWPVSDGTSDGPVIRAGAPLEITWNGGRLAMTGEISTQEKLDFIDETLGNIVAEDGAWLREYDLSGVTVGENLADETWLGPILALVQTVPQQLQVGLLRVDGNNQYVVVSGDVLERAVRDDINDRVTETALALGFDANPAVRLLDEGPTEEEVEELQEDLNDLILDQVVEFEVDSFALTERGRTLLNEVLVALESAPDDIRVLIVGHTDNQGSTASNQLLSEQRANAVFEYLVANGQDPERFDVVGKGESEPVASNDTEDGRARNRRIEFTALFEEDA